jgi:hypothetical protein
MEQAKYNSNDKHNTNLEINSQELTEEIMCHSHGDGHLTRVRALLYTNLHDVTKSLNSEHNNT